MALSVKPKYLRRYRDIFRLFVKYGRGDLADRAALEGFEVEDEDRPSQTSPAAAADALEARAKRIQATRKAAQGEPVPQPRLNGDAPVPQSKAEQLADDLERLGPTYVKAGQFLSTRVDLMPPEYIHALSRLQDNVGPVPIDQIRETLDQELSARTSKVFELFDETPIAAASIGQVHRGVLRSGRDVAVKIQRPGIREQILEDMEAIGAVAKFLDEKTKFGKRYGVLYMFEEFRRALMDELDYRLESRNLDRLADALEDFNKIVVPRPVHDLVSSRVLVMDFVEGRKITDLSPLTLMEMDGGALADEFLHAYLRQMLVDGFFHADPHPGNVFVTPDQRIALIDLGLVSRVPPSLQDQLLKLLLAVTEGRGEDAADIVLDLSHPITVDEDDALRGHRDLDIRHAKEETVRNRVAELVARYYGQKLRDMSVGRITLEISQLAAEGDQRLPRETTMVGKTLLAMDQVARALDPDFDPNQSVRRHAADIMRERIMRSLAPGRMFAGALEAKEFAEKLPRRLNSLLDQLMENRLRVRIDAIDQVLLMQGLQKVANRITVGVVIASMIIGAAMLMRVETRFQLFGYPGLAVLFFLAAGVAGLMLIVNIFLHDVKWKK